jgi:transcriptional regulator with XRE-family HTH domain
MNSKRPDIRTLPHAVTTAFRNFVLDASDDELDDALRQEGEDPKVLVERGRAAIERAFRMHEAAVDATSAIQHEAEEDKVLHEGLSKLIQLLRRKSGLSEQELAAKARVEEAEVRRIEFDPTFTPSPRTIYQLEEFFRLPPRTLVLLSGAVSRQEPEFKEEVLRFAANSKAIGKLSRQEKQLLHEFVRFLAERAKQRAENR